MAAPVNAPAAAPAAAPIDAPRTRPVAAPPMIAPVAAPHAAPCPTGVSQEVRKRQLSEMPETIMTVFVFINVGADELMNKTRAELLRNKSAHNSPSPSCCSAAICGDSGPYKDLVYLNINNQPAV